MTHIYSLHDPASNELRYIGKTVQPVNQRLSQHRIQAKGRRTHLAYWIGSLGLVCPTIRLMAIVEDSISSEVERSLIAIYRRDGFRLTNSTDGGEGMRGHVPSQQTRAKISKALKGNQFALGAKHTAEMNAHKSVRLRGNKHTLGYKPPLEVRLKISAAMRGIKKSPAHCAAMRAVRLGKKHPPERVESNRAAQKLRQAKLRGEL